jgi:hypothetical protein
MTDRFMEEAIREVDALTPAVEPFLPPRQPPTLPYGVDDYDETTQMFLWCGKWHPVEQHELEYPILVRKWREANVVKLPSWAVTR